MKGEATRLAALTGTMADSLASWRSNARKCRHFGLRAPAMLPMSNIEANAARDAAHELYWSGQVSKADLAAEVAAIAAARVAKAHRPGSPPKAEIRRLLADRDGDACWLCGEAMGEDCTIEHRTPLSRGGTWAFGNLALAHKS